MCGLFGLQSSSLSKGEVDAFKELGTLSSFRGRDSTGIATVHHGKKGAPAFRTNKFATNPVSFLYHPVIEKVLEDQRPYVIAGHCRWATVGEVNKENAHPFIEGNIIGMHNGTVEAFTPAKDKLAEESDSKNLFRFMNTNGPVETIKKAKDGAMALVWFDVEAKTINFYRNVKRPLYWSVTTSHTMFWASEGMFLDIINRRSPFTFEQPKIFDVEKIYTFPIGRTEPSNIQDLSEVLKPKTTFSMGHRPKSRFAPWTDWEGDSFDFQKAWTEYEQGTADVVALPPPPPSADDHKQLYIGYGNTTYTVPAATQALKCGCAMCGSVKEVSDTVMWMSHTEYICDGCLDTPLVKEYAGNNNFVSRLIDKETDNEN